MTIAALMQPALAASDNAACMCSQVHAPLPLEAGNWTWEGEPMHQLGQDNSATRIVSFGMFHSFAGGVNQEQLPAGYCSCVWTERNLSLSACVLCLVALVSLPGGLTRLLNKQMVASTHAWSDMLTRSDISTS